MLTLVPEAAPTIGTSSPAIDHLIAEVLREIPGTVACGLVDLGKGNFIALETSGNHPKEFLSFLATTTQAFFEGDNVRTIKAVLDEASPTELSERRIDEITFRSSRLLHVMVRVAADPSVVAAVVTSRKAKLGFVLNATRQFAADPHLGRSKRRKVGTAELRKIRDVDELFVTEE